jgi:hypothetical protein
MKAIRDLIAEFDIQQQKNLLPLAQSYIDDCKEADEMELKAEMLNRKIYELKVMQNDLLINAHKLKSGEIKSKKKRAAFICPCPGEDCNGFLNTKFNCSLCGTKVCPTCRVILGEGDEDHECKEDDVKTAEFISTTTKPCPKCGTRIHKPGGCDHMFCTKPGCATSFSWRTGLVISHTENTNPHYYEWLRTNNVDDGREIDNCAPFSDISYAIVRGRIETGLKSNQNKKFCRFLRGMQHIQRVTIPELERGITPLEGHRDLAVRFLRKEIDEKKWKTNLKRVRKKNSLNEALLEVHQGFLTTSEDIVRHLIHHESDSEEIYKSLFSFLDVADKGVKVTLKMFGSKSESWSITYHCKY